MRILSSTAPMKLLVKRKLSSVASFKARSACIIGPLHADAIHVAACSGGRGAGSVGVEDVNGHSRRRRRRRQRGQLGWWCSCYWGRLTVAGEAVWLVGKQHNQEGQSAG